MYVRIDIYICTYKAPFRKDKCTYCTQMLPFKRENLVLNGLSGQSMVSQPWYGNGMRTVHTYIRTYIHTYCITYIHTYILYYIHTYIHTYILYYIHTYILYYIHTYISMLNRRGQRQKCTLNGV